MRRTKRSGQGAGAEITRGPRRGAVLALLTFYLVAGCSDPAIVTVQANLRQGPATDSKVVAIIPRGSAIKITDCSNGWCRASWNGRDGYILTKSVRLAGARRTATEAGQPEEPDAGDDVDTGTPDEVLSAPSSLN